jgi:hypothetical protein
MAMTHKSAQPNLEVKQPRVGLLSILSSPTDAPHFDPSASPGPYWLWGKQHNTSTNLLRKDGNSKKLQRIKTEETDCPSAEILQLTRCLSWCTLTNIQETAWAGPCQCCRFLEKSGFTIGKQQ